MRPSRRGLIAGATGLGLAAAGAAVWSLRHRDDGSLQRVRAAGVLRVGYAVEPPYAALMPGGEVGGESPEVARDVATQLGLKPAWVKTAFERLLPELEARRFDIVAAGLFVNAERARRVRFSRPTLRVRAGWLVARGNPKALEAYARLAGRSGLRVVAIAGSVEHVALQALALPAGSLVTVPDAQSGLAAVGSGQADGLALSLPTVRHMAHGAGGVLEAVPAGGDGAGEHLTALAMHRDDEALQRAVDAALATYIGSAPHLAMLARFDLGADDLPRSQDGR